MRRVEWLRWWRRNLGMILPYLQVEMRWKESTQYQRGRLPESTCEFLLELLSSAQYISVGRLYQYLIKRRMEAGYVVKVHPNAHTIVSTWLHRLDLGGNEYQKSLLSQTQSTLRCITIENAKLGASELTNPLNNWSTLTHISMNILHLHLTTWFFIRSLSALQSGSFYLRLEDPDIETYARPSICVLPCLAVFHITVSSESLNSPGQYPLKAAFDNLQLPALRTLSLRSLVQTWYDSTALTEVHAALVSAPAITKLSLGLSFLGAQGLFEFLRRLMPITEDITPLVEYAPRLEHITFAMACLLNQHGYGWFLFVDRVFASSWLDLKSPVSTIRKVTFVSSNTSQEAIDAAELACKHGDRDLLISKVRKFVNDEVGVGFEEEESVEVRRARWGW